MNRKCKENRTRVGYDKRGDCENMEEQKYKTWPVVKRLVGNMRKQDARQPVRVAVYTVAAGLYPFLAVFLPKIAIGTLEHGGEDVAKRLIIAMVVYFAVAALLGYVSEYLNHMIQIKNMRNRVFYLVELGDKLTTMDYKYVEDAGFWEKNKKAMSAGNNNVEGIEGVSNRLCTLPALVVSLAGMMILAGNLSPWILLALVFHVAVTMWVSAQNHKYRYARKEQEAKQQRKIDYYYKTTHDFSFGKDIRIYNFRDRILKNYQAEIEGLKALTAKLAKHEYLLGLAGIATLLLTNVLMYGILIVQTLNGMPISSFTMYISLITSLMAYMLKLGEDISFIRNQGQYVGDFFRLMDERLEDEKEEIRTEDMKAPEIAFAHVDFKYPGCENYVYRDLNFTIHSGERLAIVGVNGAGKSTLVKLMTGLFEPTAGHIYINGTDISRFRKKDLYRLYSVAFQDVNILAFTIRENVTGASENADDKRVQEALEKVGLWKKVQGFEKGPDQMMLKVVDENGTDFSGGERQKLSIARALYKDAPMVIMDEPTAALDALAEAEIYESFSDMVEGKTAVYISHRLASTKFCDKIALFDKDGLKEYGSHEELMAKKGEYYHMFTVQGKYYREDAVTNAEEVSVS
ncbi:MAG: ABC transporter ATP-binding protein [Acetatifactor sp.]